tara:strand:- start:709 stop:891 length:183 start_codon:yes stop_codon:yes gene_type:complete
MAYDANMPGSLFRKLESRIPIALRKSMNTIKYRKIFLAIVKSAFSFRKIDRKRSSIIMLA